MVAALTKVPSWRTTSSIIPTGGIGVSSLGGRSEIDAEHLDLVAPVDAHVGGGRDQLLNLGELRVHRFGGRAIRLGRQSARG